MNQSVAKITPRPLLGPEDGATSSGLRHRLRLASISRGMNGGSSGRCDHSSHAAQTNRELERYQNMTRGNVIDWTPLPDVSRHKWTKCEEQRMSRLLNALAAQPDAPSIITDQEEVNRRYRRWRPRVLGTALLGYMFYYFVRTNIANAVPDMGRTLHYSKAQLGLVLSIGQVTYGVSKFVNGFLGDRANPRYFMAIGLFLCVAMNIAFGMSSALFMLILFWFLNNWAQGMGFPPCARTMGYWFSPRERSTTFGIWHTSHMLGAAIVAIITGQLIQRTGNWRLCFFVPAAIAIIGCFLAIYGLRDTPGSMGLPPVEVYKGEESQAAVAAETLIEEPYFALVVQNIFMNRYMWIISFANALVYALRYTVLNWGPSFLREFKHMSAAASGSLLSGFEMSGLVSALIAGYVADRWFNGKAGRVCVLAMGAMTIIVYLFWKAPISSPRTASVYFMLMGFMTYVPQMLIAAMAMNLGTKRAAAAAVGLTGILGYASSVVSGWGVGKLVDHSGWDGAFLLMIGCAAGTVVLMAMTWNVGFEVGGDPNAADAAEGR